MRVVSRPRAWCLATLLASLVFSSPTRAEIYFEDDFESPEYIDQFGLPSDIGVQDEGGWLFVDENMPVETSTWTITNPGGRGNPPTADGSPSFGAFLISDSDAQAGSNPPGSGMSHDVWSPVIDVTGATTVWLHFDCLAELNDNGFAVFDIDVTTNDGETWTNVFRRVAPSRPAAPLPNNSNADGFFGRLDLDLSAVAAGEEIRIRWRHFEPNFDWWIAIDNVVVDDQPSASAVANQPPQGRKVILLAPESFAAGIPETWELRSDAVPPNEGTETWHTTDKGRRYTPGGIAARGVNRLTHPDADPNFAILDSDADPDPAEDEYLITPVLDATCAERVFLRFKDEIVPTGALQEVLVSIDGGSSFEPAPIFSYSLGAGFDGGEEPFYAARTFEVPVAALEPEVSFAFHYQSGGNEWWWAIDEVEVIGIDLDGDCVSCGNCVRRGFANQPFNPATREVALNWLSLDGDTRHVLSREGQLVMEFAGDVTSFTDAPPPFADIPCITYTLESYAGDTLCTSCTLCVTARLCPSDLRCCYDRTGGAVELSWQNGVNVDGAAWRIRRNGVPLSSVSLATNSFTDARVPGPGVYEYTLELQGGNAAQCPDLPLRCSAVVTGGEILFFDDFECYGSDTDIEAAGWQLLNVNDPVEVFSRWTVQNPGGRRNPPTERGSPSTGRFLISDSDFAGGANPTGSGMSHDVWTPEIDCSAATKVWIHFDCSAQLNNNGEAIFFVDVSSDDGESWTTVFERIAPGRTSPPFPADGVQDGFFGRLHIDATDAAAGERSVIVRIRQFEPNDDWWIAIDNFQVDTLPRIGGDTTLLDLEEFAGGIPDDWELETPDPFGQWAGLDACFIVDAGDTGLHHFGAEHAAVCSSAVDEYLITPVFDASEAEQVYLHVKSAIHLGGVIAEILVSFDDGETYLPDPVFRYDTRSLFDPLEDPFYGEYIFEVPDAVGQEGVVFAFHFAATGLAAQGWWAIDDVEVTADTGGPVGARFVRGDADGNGAVNLNDGIVGLNFLFLGFAPPACVDAADADDGGTLLLNDSILIFNWLFTGGPRPAAPSPSSGNYPASDCGVDPTPDALECLRVSPTCS